MSEDRQEQEAAMELQAMEHEVVRALERRPQVMVPAGFAARIVQALPAAGASRSPQRAGKTAALLAAVLLAGALFVVAPHAGPSFANVGFDLELLVLAELAAVAWVLARMDTGWL